MRDFKSMKRQRGRNRSGGPGGGGGGGGGGGKPQQNANRAFESNGPDNLKIRGHAQHVFEKYQQLARDATSAGDRVLAENFLQHAEHYFRLIRTLQPNRPYTDIISRDGFASGYDIDFEDEGGEASDEQEASSENGDAAGGEDRNDYRDQASRQDRWEPRNGEGRQDQGRQDQSRSDQPRQDYNRQDQSRGDQSRGGYAGGRNNGGGNANYNNNGNRDRNFNRDRNDGRWENRNGDGQAERGETSGESRGEDRRPERQDRDRFDSNRSDQPRTDQARSDQARSDQPRSDQPRSDQPRSDQGRSDRDGYGRRERPYGERGEQARESVAAVEPQAAPTPAERPESEPVKAAAAPKPPRAPRVLRSRDGDESHTPAFLQASSPPAAAAAPVEEAAPVKRPRGRPRKAVETEEV